MLDVLRKSSRGKERQQKSFGLGLPDERRLAKDGVRLERVLHLLDAPPLRSEVVAHQCHFYTWAVAADLFAEIYAAGARHSAVANHKRQIIALLVSVHPWVWQGFVPGVV